MAASKDNLNFNEEFATCRISVVVSRDNVLGTKSPSAERMPRFSLAQLFFSVVLIALIVAYPVIIRFFIILLVPTVPAVIAIVVFGARNRKEMLMRLVLIICMILAVAAMILPNAYSVLE
jgi:hypothetical protein